MHICIRVHMHIHTLLRGRRNILDLVALPSVGLARGEPSCCSGLLARSLGFCSLRQSFSAREDCLISHRGYPSHQVLESEEIVQPQKMSTVCGVALLDPSAILSVSILKVSKIWLVLVLASGQREGCPGPAQTKEEEEEGGNGSCWAVCWAATEGISHAKYPSA